MSQASNWGVPSAGPASPTTMATRMNDSFNALLSNNKGASRPSYAAAGTFWVDDSSSPWRLYFYDGTSDILISYIDQTAHQVTFSNTVRENTEFTIGTGGDFESLADAVAHVAGLIPLDNATITLRVLDGVVTEDAEVIWDHPFGAQFILRGAAVTALTGISLVSIDSSGGAGNHLVTLQFSGGVSACTVGRYVHIVLTTGTGDHENLRGHWEITNVDAGNNRITVKVTDRRASMSATTVTDATVNYVPSALEWNNGTSGIIMRSPLTVQDITIKGDGTLEKSGIQVGYGAFLTLQSVAGVVGWSRGVYVITGFVLSNYAAVCDCGNGWYFVNGSNGNIPFTIGNGNNRGYVVSAAAHVGMTGSTAAGNAVALLVDGKGSNVVAQTCQLLRSTGNNVEVDQEGYADIGGSTVSGAGAYGLEVDGGGSFDDASVTYSSNTSGDRNNLAGARWDGSDYSLVVQDFGIDKAQGTLTFNASGVASDIRDGATSGHIEIRPNSQNRDVIFKVRATDVERARIDMTDGSYQFANGVHVYSGSGSPEGAQTAVVGSIWLRSNGGASTTLYVKESGSGNTGWVAK